DREDIHTLATSLDDILDNMEETAQRFVAFRIDRPTQEAVALAEIIRQACIHLGEALKLTRTMKDVEGIQHHLRAVGRLENKADPNYRNSDSTLFADPPDRLRLIQ